MKDLKRPVLVSMLAVAVCSARPWEFTSDIHQEDCTLEASGSVGCGGATRQLQQSSVRTVTTAKGLVDAVWYEAPYIEIQRNLDLTTLTKTDIEKLNQPDVTVFKLGWIPAAIQAIYGNCASYSSPTSNHFPNQCLIETDFPVILMLGSRTAASDADSSLYLQGLHFYTSSSTGTVPIGGYPNAFISCGTEAISHDTWPTWAKLYMKEVSFQGDTNNEQTGLLVKGAHAYGQSVVFYKLGYDSLQFTHQSTAVSVHGGSLSLDSSIFYMNSQTSGNKRGMIDSQQEARLRLANIRHQGNTGDCVSNLCNADGDRYAIIEDALSVGGAKPVYSDTFSYYMLYYAKLNAPAEAKSTSSLSSVPSRNGQDNAETGFLSMSDSWVRSVQSVVNSRVSKMAGTTQSLEEVEFELLYGEEEAPYPSAS